METTFNTQALVVDRYPFKEFDSRVIVFSKDKGRLDLVARGARRSTSKIACHIEPISISSIMIVPGKTYDYAGSVKGSNFYSGIKKDLDKVMLAGRALCLIKNITKEGEEGDFPRQYGILKDFFDILDKEDRDSKEKIYIFFAFKMLYELGFLPDPEVIFRDDRRQQILTSILKDDFEKACGSQVSSRDVADIRSKIRKFLDFNLEFPKAC